MNNKKRQRTFNVEFLPIIEMKNQNEQLVSIPINIVDKLETLMKIPAKTRFKNINGENIRLQDIRKIDSKNELFLYDNISCCNNLWFLKFIKFKDNEVYGIADEEGNYDEEAFENLINNTPNKGHLASPTVCLYDGDKNIIIIARNREGVTVGEILEFTVKTFKNKNLDFGYISNKTNFNMSSVTTYKNIDFSFSELNSMPLKDRNKLSESAPSVYSAIKGATSLGLNTFAIKGSMGNERRRGLSSNVGKEALFLSRSGIESISRVKIGVVLEGQKTIETIDFLQDRLTDYFNVYIESGSRLKSNLIEGGILKSYDNNYNSI